MKILFKDKKDVTPLFKNEFTNHYIIGARESLTKEMLQCEILSVKITKVHNILINKMPNLKWIINRSHKTDNINLKHCKKHNIGVINTYPASKEISNWIENVVKKQYYLPYYTLVGNYSIGNSINEKFEYIKTITCDLPERKIIEYIATSNTVIIDIPFTKCNKRIINKKFFDLLPPNANMINISNGKVINNKDLLYAINTGKIYHVTMDNIDCLCRDELLNTGKVVYTKNSAWKYEIDTMSYIQNIKNHIKDLIDGNPQGVILEREDKKIDIFWD